MHRITTSRELARAAILSLIALAAAPALAAAQQTPTDSLRAELERLRARVDSLTRVVAELRAAGQDTTEAADDLAAIRAAAAAAAGRAGAEAAPGAGAAGPDTTGPTRFAGRQRSQQSLNPEITVTGDLFGFLDMDHPGEESFVPRAVEVSFQSALDPFALAKVFIGYHEDGGGLAPFEEHLDVEPTGPEAPAGEEDAHGGHGGELALEEAYILWRSLPGGFNLSAGRFRQNFGTLNRWHPHALPGQTYPLPYLAFFGEEGLAQTGLGVHWLAPVQGLGTWELWGEATASSNEALFGEARSLSLLGRVNAFWELSAATYFELGGNVLAGPGMAGDEALATRVYGGDFALSWRPPERGRYREATLRGGVVMGELAPVLEAGVDAPGPALGGFAIAEYRLDRRWIVGGRFEYTENPLHPEESTWLAAPTLTWWQSEWVRLRAELDWLERPDETLKLLVLQATFAMGPHKHETY